MATTYSPKVKAHWWITAWFLIATPIVIWDAGFCFMRPRSFRGGDLHWIWKPYALYQDIDYVYGVKTYESGHGFTNAQSFLNIIETVMNVIYVYLSHISTPSPSAPVIGFAAAVMTLSKTVLYMAQEYYCNYCSVGHNNAFDLFFLWIIPNGAWIVLPGMITYRLGKDLSAALASSEAINRAAAKAKNK